MRASPLLFLALSAWVQAGPTDPCTTMLAALSSKGFLAPSVVRPCYEYFEYDPVQANETIAALRSILENEYIFLEALAHPPDESVQMPVDILANVELALKKNHTTDLSFQEDVSQALVGANDGHLSYDPLCYRTILFNQPLFMAMVAGENYEPLVVIYTVDIASEKTLGKYIGSIVRTIDGKDANEVLTAYSNDMVGTCKDPQTRLTKTLSSTYYDGNNFVYDRGAFAQRRVIPEKDAVTYGLTDPKTKRRFELTLNWNGYITEGLVGPQQDVPFTDARSYMKAYCSPRLPKAPKQDPSIEKRNSTSKVASSDLFLKQANFPIPKTSVAHARLNMTSTPSSASVGGNIGPQNAGRDEKDKLVNGSPSLREVQDSTGKQSTNGTSDTTSSEEMNEMMASLKNISTPILSGPGFGFFLLDDPISGGILSISTFNGGDNDQGDVQGLWLQQMAKGMETFKRFGVKKLILDLTNNGGGTTCLSSVLSALLDPAPDMPFPTSRMPFFTNLLVSPVVEQISKSAIASNTYSPFLVTSYINPETGVRGSDRPQ
ncbi:hypothetical protein BJ684DRAFT_20616 [Piptocephalis cylindrospora]|uniref:Uncharacterized protein n=1 Tax=Piptocephalis cylindrospora TaxID=1907219 RepID=A0A4P9Y236_9FUNG|nr:hypothetical protein BJ684DRAFT_20616 [Piptocephalis cylindrospora]|eukprot:RKP12865.1 hypothetical protein BJ684DRAFT_20616 [Piptocephalis cylindrospora]